MKVLESVLWPHITFSKLVPLDSSPITIMSSLLKRSALFYAPHLWLEALCPLKVKGNIKGHRVVFLQRKNLLGNPSCWLKLFLFKFYLTCINVKLNSFYWWPRTSRKRRLTYKLNITKTRKTPKYSNWQHQLHAWLWFVRGEVMCSQSVVLTAGHRLSSCSALLCDHQLTHHFSVLQGLSNLSEYPEHLAGLWKPLWVPPPQCLIQ